MKTNNYLNPFWCLWLGLALIFGWITPAKSDTQDGTLIKTIISVVGPRNLSYLPIDLLPLIQADKAEGLEVQLKHVGGGGIAIKELITRNSDFTVVGFPALMSLKAHEGKLVGIAAVSDIPQYSLIVRAALQDKIHRIADLKGHIIGVHTSTANAKTVAQQLIKLLLEADGLQSQDARIISSGQDWDKRAALLESGQIDALISEEPFASSLQAAGKVFFLFNPSEPNPTQKIPGIHFLHATLATRPDVVDNNPEKIKRMVKALHRSLRWIATHSAFELVEQLGITDVQEKENILLSLKKYPRLFSQDGKFSNRQIQETNRFFHHGAPEATHINMEELINDQWIGRKE